MDDPLARYYFSLEREGRKRTLHLARTLLDPAIAEFGHVKVKELRPFAVRDWLAKMSDPKRPCKNRRERPWGTTTQHAAIEKLPRAFYWAKKEGMITANPIARPRPIRSWRSFLAEHRPYTVPTDTPSSTAASLTE